MKFPDFSLTFSLTMDTLTAGMTSFAMPTGCTAGACNLPRTGAMWEAPRGTPWLWGAPRPAQSGTPSPDRSISRCHMEAVAGSSVTTTLKVFPCVTPNTPEEPQDAPVRRSVRHTLMNPKSRAHTPKIEVFSSQNLVLPTERVCSN